MIDPIVALTVFASISILGFLFFRPDKGYFWLIKSALKRDEKVITEDILKQLYHLEYSGGKATINNLVGSFKINHGQLVKLLTGMESKGLITSNEGLVQLSTSGRDYALKIIRVHRLWEKYLAEKTGVNKSEWHSKAEEMEHELSGMEVDELAEQL